MKVPTLKHAHSGSIKSPISRPTGGMSERSFSNNIHPHSLTTDFDVDLGLLSQQGQQAGAGLGGALGSTGFEHRVARAISACTRCRSRKSKCDGKLPACSACEKAKVECVGFDAIAKKNVSRSYIHELEQEVTSLRAQLGLSTASNGDPSFLSSHGHGSGTSTPLAIHPPSRHQEHQQQQPTIKLEPMSSMSRSPPDDVGYDGGSRDGGGMSGYMKLDQSSGRGFGQGQGNAEAGPSGFRSSIGAGMGVGMGMGMGIGMDLSAKGGSGLEESSIRQDRVQSMDTSGYPPLQQSMRMPQRAGPGQHHQHLSTSYGSNGGGTFHSSPHHLDSHSRGDEYAHHGSSHYGSRSNSIPHGTPTQRDIDGVISDIAFAGREAASDIPKAVGHYLGTSSGVSLTRMVLDAVLREGVASGHHAGTGKEAPRKRDSVSFQPGMSRPDSPDHGHSRHSFGGKIHSPLEGGSSMPFGADGQNGAGSSHGGHDESSQSGGTQQNGSPGNDRRPISVPALPPPAAVDRLVQVYIDFVQIMLPVLHMPTFEKQLTRVRERSPDVQDSDIFFVLMVLALSTMALSRSLDPTAELRMSSEAFYMEAVKHMEPIFEDQTYMGLQAILLCCSYSLLNPRRGSIWFLVGLASRTCVDHGFHHETEQDESLGPLERDMRRRLFHAVYNLDRLLGHALGRPPSIPDDFVNVPAFSNLPDSAITEHGLLPADPDPYKLVAINFIRLRQVQSAISTRLYSVKVQEAPSEDWFFDRFEELKSWLAAAPEPRGAASAEGYAISFHNTVMLLFRPSPACPRPSRDALATCLSSSSYIIRIFRTIQKKNKISWFWLTSHYVFMAGITYLYGLWNMNLIGDSSVTPSLRDAVLDCQACLATLDALAVTVPSARACKSTFEMLSTAIIRRLTGEQGLDGSDVGIDTLGALGSDITRSNAPLGTTSVHAESAMRHSFQSQGLPSPLPRLDLPTELTLLESLFLNPLVSNPKASQTTAVGQHPAPSYLAPSPAQSVPRFQSYEDFQGAENAGDYHAYYGTPVQPESQQLHAADTPSSMYNLAAAAAAMTPSAQSTAEGIDPSQGAFVDSVDMNGGGFDFLSFLAADDGGQGANAVWEQTEHFRQDMPMMG